jgi:hypothetical protein
VSVCYDRSLEEGSFRRAIHCGIVELVTATRPCVVVDGELGRLMKTAINCINRLLWDVVRRDVEMH